MWLLRFLFCGSLVLMLGACPTAAPNKTCSTNDDCFTDVGYVCDSNTSTCMPGCDDDNDCVISKRCIKTGTEGVCMVGTRGDTGSGD